MLLLALAGFGALVPEGLPWSSHGVRLALATGVALPVREVPALATHGPKAVAPGLTPAKVSAPVGMLVTQLYNFRPAESSFDAEFWLWSEQLADGTDVLDTSSFANAYDTKRSPRRATIVQSEGGERTIILQKVRGTFHHDWRLIHFPFDHQNLQIILEEDQRDASALRLVPDLVNSSFDASIAGDWRLVRYSLNSDERHYDSSFGEHQDRVAAQSQFSRLVMTMDLARTSIGPLWRLCAAPLAAVLIVLLTYFIHLSVPGALPGRGGLIGASLFAEIISLRAVSGPVDNGDPLTLIEALHLLAILYTIAAATITAVFCLMESRALPTERINRWDRRAGVITTLLLVPPVIALFLDALHGG